ncbi:hypothetical protein ACN23B_16640 [Anabaena sp. FACHB-709]|uniref:Uncharacterized protein n=2 Tax=Nostocaceae TaxID=1162 RepID=A0A1Z4KIY1_ANAVA|nr:MULTISPECIES: hypothetical protein [Nostocaceae]BAY68941.1 hypothetical protein NIES23_17310 [Trichormus variabilis NIES-23]HBW33447.1 hypothetical protein [Nostoc sp. UBA8866]MBD2170513.1 hypothetical protein [Anabaena cylindrica FACHB-318]MBD2262011.1 hypothetical protein [Anabaena sp. FACHB-709]MBD2271846.1 hypothetical protein [Nostoc sp. PCC 7120 = FACHB-418]
MSFKFKHPRKPPVSPETEKPFFPGDQLRATRGDRPTPSPFFSSKVTIQPKLNVGQPNDVYEQEANAVANNVSEPNIQRLATEEDMTQTSILQKSEEPEEIQTQVAS